MRGELLEVKERFATPRRTVLEDEPADTDIEDLIQREDMVVTVTHGGYVKRVPLSTYRAQRRGGKGRAGMATRDDDFVIQVFVANTHTPVLFFSSTGIVYKLKVWRLPLGTPQARGKAIVNLLPLRAGETITTLMPLPEDEAMGRTHRRLRHRVRRRAPQRAHRFHQRQRQRQDRDEAGRGRPAGSRAHVHRRRRHPAVHAARPRIRFRSSEVRVFSGRTSTGVRGMRSPMATRCSA